MSKYAQEQDHHLPKLPAGNFVSVSHTSMYSVFIFQFAKTQPCSKVTNVQSLPIPIHQPISLPIPTHQVRGLCTSYLYLQNSNYEIVDTATERGIIYDNTSEPSTIHSDIQENERNIVLLMALKQRAEKHYSSIKLAWVGEDVSHFSPFSGGAWRHIYAG